MRKKPEKLFPKLTGHELFYNDALSDYQFYGKLNEFMDISVLMFNTETRSVREFVVDSAIFAAIHQFSKEGKFEPYAAFVNAKGSKPQPVRTLVDKEGYQIIKTGSSKIIKSFVVAKVSKFFVDDKEYNTLEIKRLVFKSAEGTPMIGMDTMSIPEYVAPEFINLMKRLFNREDLELEFEGEENAND